MAHKYKRVLLKISGESFCAEGGRGIDVEEASSIAGQIAKATDSGVGIAVVVGGGNIVRGAELSKRGVTAATADQMGMLATVVNALALQDLLEHRGLQVRVLSAVPISPFAEPFIRRRAMRHLEKGRLVILAAGTGNPHFTTDTAAALRAVELGADVLLKGTKVDGVYTDDPKRNAAAKRFESLAYLDVLNQRLEVMDGTAITLCMEHSLPILVFDLKKDGNIRRAVRGEPIGTLIAGAETAKSGSPAAKAGAPAGKSRS